MAKNRIVYCLSSKFCIEISAYITTTFIWICLSNNSSKPAYICIYTSHVPEFWSRLEWSEFTLIFGCHYFCLRGKPRNGSGVLFCRCWKMRSQVWWACRQNSVLQLKTNAVIVLNASVIVSMEIQCFQMFLYLYTRYVNKEMRNVGSEFDGEQIICKTIREVILIYFCRWTDEIRNKNKFYISERKRDSRGRMIEFPSSLQKLDFNSL